MPGDSNFGNTCYNTGVGWDAGNDSPLDRPEDVTACCVGYSSCYQSTFRATNTVNMECDTSTTTAGDSNFQVKPLTLP